MGTLKVLLIIGLIGAILLIGLLWYKEKQKANAIGGLEDLALAYFKF